MERREVSAKEQLESMANLDERQRHAQLSRIAETLGERFAELVSPPGKCEAALVRDFPLLEKRRLEYGIPDKAFDQEATYDRILVHQVPRVLGNKIEGSVLFMPETARQRNEESTPRGVIVSAGLRARDNLVSNGMDIGHVVNFIRLSPFRLPYLSISGVEMFLLVMRDGDIVSSEDVPAMKLRGELKVVTKVDEKGREFFSYDGHRSRVPFIPEDY